MGMNPGNRIRIRKEKEEEIEKKSGGSSGNNGAHSQEPPPPKEPLPGNLQDCMNEIRSQYGDEVANETWRRAEENSPPGDHSRFTVAYLNKTASMIVKDRQKEADLISGKPRYDDQGREIWDEY